MCWIASRGDSQTTYAIILKESVSLLQELKIEIWEAQTGMCQRSASTFENSYRYTALDVLE